jgi:predicted transcriptional regulator
MQELTEIQKLRKSLDWTQKELANRSGVSQSLIAKVEANKIDPTYSKIMNIFDALNQASHHDKIKVSDIINREIISISPNVTIAQAIMLMKKHGISQMPVIDHHPIGLISEGVLLDSISRYSTEEIKIIPVKDIMTECPPILSPDCPFEIITSLLKHYPMVLVKDKEKVCGLVTKSDVLNALSKK